MPAEYPVPDEAVPMVIKWLDGPWLETEDEEARALLAEVAPLIAAAALRQAAEEYTAHIKAAVESMLADLGGEANTGQRWDAFSRQADALAVAAWLRQRADAIDHRPPAGPVRAALEETTDG